MVSKRFSQHLCVLCQERYSTTTGDHIFARQFFLEHDRGDLPKAPCCSECGTEKSKDEHYLTAVLPFGGRHGAARENLTSMVPKRLAKNRRLHQELSTGLEVSDEGRPTMLPLDSTRITSLFERITIELLWYEWGVYLPQTHRVVSTLLAPGGEELFSRLFSFSAARRATANLGSDTFEYVGAQGTDDPAFSAWRYSIYGGLQMTGDRSSPESVSRFVGCLTARRDTLALHPLE